MLRLYTSCKVDAFMHVEKVSVCVCFCVCPCSHVNDEYVPAMSSDSPSRGKDPQIEYTTGTETAYSQTMSIAQG